LNEPREATINGGFFTLQLLPIPPANSTLCQRKENARTGIFPDRRRQIRSASSSIHGRGKRSGNALPRTFAHLNHLSVRFLFSSSMSSN
jgi:hypothetical protein